MPGFDILNFCLDKFSLKCDDSIEYLGESGECMENKDEILQLIDQYYEDYFRFDAVYYRWAADFKIKDTTLFILERIYSAKEICTQKYLCEKLSYPKQTISAALNRLEKQGMIQRSRHSEDTRGNVISLTPKGRRFTEKAVGGMRQLEIQAYEHMTQEERETVTRGLHILADALDWAFES